MIDYNAFSDELCRIHGIEKDAAIFSAMTKGVKAGIKAFKPRAQTHRALRGGSARMSSPAGDAMNKAYGSANVAGLKAFHSPIGQLARKAAPLVDAVF